VGRWNSVTAAGQSEGIVVGQIDRTQDSNLLGNGDNIRQWESLITLAATSFYRGGTIVPFIATAYDWVNAADEVLWNVDYFYTNDLIFSLEQRYFWSYTGHNLPSNDPWYAGGRFTRRDETSVRVTFQF
jgi:hypothetical protein